jgi:adenosylhomocysteine nucleosidase
MTIGIIIATMMEAEPFIQCFGMKEVEARPFTVYEGRDAFVVISGIGKVNAAMATSYACLKFDPVLILNLGAAGATESATEPGRIYHVEKTIEPDRIHLRTNTPYVLRPDVLDGFDMATLATRDRAVIDIDTFKSTATIADLVDMEGASVVQASRRFNKKCFLFKFVSDTPAHIGQYELILRQIKSFRGPFCDFILSSVAPAINRR